MSNGADLKKFRLNAFSLNNISYSEIISPSHFKVSYELYACSFNCSIKSKILETPALVSFPPELRPREIVALLTAKPRNKHSSLVSFCCCV